MGVGVGNVMCVRVWVGGGRCDVCVGGVMTCVRSPQKVCISACELAHSTPLPLGSGTADNVTVVLLEDSAGGQQKTPPTRVASHVGSILDCTFFASNQQVRTHTHTHTCMHPTSYSTFAHLKEVV